MSRAKQYHIFYKKISLPIIYATQLAFAVDFFSVEVQKTSNDVDLEGLCTVLV